MKFTILTLGCKVNIYESEVMKELLQKADFSYVEKEEEADIILINTCTVTNVADQKSMKMVRRAKRLEKIVVVCGCSSENKQKEYQKIGIDILIGNHDKSKIVPILKKYLETKNAYTKFYPKQEFSFEDMGVEKFTTHTRAFLKIQDGCNNFCSYCIIPYVRKNIRSKSFVKAIEEIKKIVANGHKEIVLTGIHTGSYFAPEKKDLADLLHEMRNINGLERIRISSIEITELNSKMLNEIKENNKIVNHFHIPLQAGSNEILKRMNRKYDLNLFFKIIEKIREIKPEVSITTDVIVGHPYETEELFNKTIENCQKLQFSKIHVFPYSIREKTPSASMPCQVCEEEKKKRSRLLNEQSKKLEEAFYKNQMGKTVEVLIEQVKEQESRGLTTNYLKVIVEETLEKNTLYDVKIEKYKNGYLWGHVIKK